MPMKHLICAATLGLAVHAGPALADGTAAVTAFYDLLSNPGEQAHVDAFLATTKDTWESIGTYSGQAKTRDAFLGQVGGFGQLIPDLDWAIQDMHVADDAITVRSRATGTPVAPFFGVDGAGRSFDIMTIDIHEVKDGTIVRTYHVEDWATALQQLSGQ